jgi:hypothetical protein
MEARGNTGVTPHRSAPARGLLALPGVRLSDAALNGVAVLVDQLRVVVDERARRLGWGMLVGTGVWAAERRSTPQAR